MVSFFSPLLSVIFFSFVLFFFSCFLGFLLLRLLSVSAKILSAFLPLAAPNTHTHIHRVQAQNCTIFTIVCRTYSKRHHTRFMAAAARAMPQPHCRQVAFFLFCSSRFVRILLWAIISYEKREDGVPHTRTHSASAIASLSGVAAASVRHGDSNKIQVEQNNNKPEEIYKRVKHIGSAYLCEVHLPHPHPHSRERLSKTTTLHSIFLFSRMHFYCCPPFFSCLLPPVSLFFIIFIHLLFRYY